MADIIQLRIDTEANWTLANPILALGEMAITKDTTPQKFKVGTGLANWLALPYFAGLTGEQGRQGDIGLTGATGASIKGDTGDRGLTGLTGATGYGVVAGGVAGQALVKIDTTDYNTQWVDMAGGSNLLTLLHTNYEVTTSETSFDYLYDGVIIPDFTRHTSKLKLGAISSGNGQVQVQISDGTTTVTQVMSVINSVGVRKKDSVNIDCSTLADVGTGKYWNVTIYAKAVTGDYTLNKFTLQGIPVDFMSGQTMIQTNPMTSVSTNVATILDTRYFPINYAIDNSCQIRFLASVTLGTGVTSAELRCRLTTSNGSTVSANECLLNVSASGIVQGYIDFPNIVTPTVKVEVFGKVTGGAGVVTLGHYECWMEE